jgi:microcystin-dependent protein
MNTKKILHDLIDATFTTNGNKQISGAKARETHRTLLDAQYLPAGFPGEWYGPESTIPEGWHLCDGSSFSITEYNDLFLALGGYQSPYGVDVAAGTFKIPYAQPGTGFIQQGINPDTGTNFQLGKTGGEETHLLKDEETPLRDHWHYGFRKGDPGKHFLHDYPEEHPTTDDSSTYGDNNYMTRMGSSSSEPDAGRTGGQKSDDKLEVKSHNNMSPYMAINKTIKLW